MRRHLRTLGVFVANSVQLDLEYRASFAINSVNSLIGAGAGFLVLSAMFQRGAEVGGWRFAEALTLFGVFLIAEATVNFLIRPSLTKVSEYVREGGMDYMLLKPMNLQFLVSLRTWNIWALPNMAVGVGIVLYGTVANGTLTPANLALFAVMLGSGLVVIYALWASLAVTAFWSVQAGNAIFILYSMMGSGRFPVTAYPPWLRLFFTIVVPIAFVTTVPAAAAIGRLDWSMALGSLAAAAISLGLSAFVWRLAARSYTSASS